MLARAVQFPWRSPAVFAVAGVLLTGCAAAVPGYMPPPAEKPGKTADNDKRPLAMGAIKSFESGAVTASGAYTPSAAEKALDCRKLNGSMQIIVARLKDHHNRPKPSGVAAAAQGAAASLKGRDNVMDLDAELQRERARLAAYNTLLAEKKCPTMDIDGALKGKS